MFTRRKFIILLGGVSLVGLTGCGSEDQEVVSCGPVGIESGDECAVCGMFIAEYPGPKAQACLRDGRVLKFCSTSDMFVWLLQPDSVPKLKQAYVHDMGVTEWDSPGDDAYIEADVAYYVTEQPMMGAMGPTLASFGTEEEARAFMAEHEGRLLTYKEVDVQVLNDLARAHIRRTM
ncbi:nitrous oxide reductase accessory protein NosL [Billgrantia kenyensis]|uniref:Nitrous oxide reductase accessory protein NosL n=1 Tax=Billgrantia kenyensis TaxID=321266 RepID=A0A7W0AFY2_9GAMM|nr:nitrous oxide reductase accessory protein NosL [Halomonas kenyensis]MBA2781059.1 nitrous oxide reductase accessory protein NosL [Halomonas kenyensis]MCG6661510.1 NosL family protein [Halomonas kenyensis]